MAAELPNCDDYEGEVPMKKVCFTRNLIVPSARKAGKRIPPIVGFHDLFVDSSTNVSGFESSIQSAAPASFAHGHRPALASSASMQEPSRAAAARTSTPSATPCSTSTEAGTSLARLSGMNRTIRHLRRCVLRGFSPQARRRR